MFHLYFVIMTSKNTNITIPQVASFTTIEQENTIVITDENWQGFIEDINCQAANKYSYFEQTFERYFY